MQEIEHYEYMKQSNFFFFCGTYINLCFLPSKGTHFYKSSTSNIFMKEDEFRIFKDYGWNSKRTSNFCLSRSNLFQTLLF